ncbi:TadE family protein [Sphingomonas sp. KR3-1]|uniref:TadE/TadG family type IV pilus assembly protein n=1 Tax=Sphingomonas sp. KR3-1 TaxID=3156611 RepID=UPI0032B4E121
MRTPRLLRRLRRDRSGLAMLEFAMMLPIFATMCLGGAELTNYIITKMRLSQIALQLADNAARIGSGTQLEAKTISELDINDLLTGADLQAGELKLFTNGHVIISSVEPDTATGHDGKSLIRWQRCKGDKTNLTSKYTPGQNNLVGVGDDTRLVGAPSGGVTMFVELRYIYTPLIKTALSPTTEFREIASMMVRDRRDTSDDSKKSDGTNNPDSVHPNGVYKVTGVTAAQSANC